jgi:hypothetical protein
VQFDPHTAFPVPHNRPLCHLSDDLTDDPGVYYAGFAVDESCKKVRSIRFCIGTGRKSVGSDLSLRPWPCSSNAPFRHRHGVFGTGLESLADLSSGTTQSGWNTDRTRGARERESDGRTARSRSCCTGRRHRWLIGSAPNLGATRNVGTTPARLCGRVSEVADGMAVPIAQAQVKLRPSRYANVRAHWCPSLLWRF